MRFVSIDHTQIWLEQNSLTHTWNMPCKIIKLKNEIELYVGKKTYCFEKEGWLFAFNFDKTRKCKWLIGNSGGRFHYSGWNGEEVWILDQLNPPVNICQKLYAHYRRNSLSYNIVIKNVTWLNYTFWIIYRFVKSRFVENTTNRFAVKNKVKRYNNKILPFRNKSILNVLQIYRKCNIPKLASGLFAEN